MAVDSPKRQYKNPVAVASAFGRVFWAVDSIVMYSQVLQGVNDVGRCYQNNDPTSSEIPDLLDTDGGVVELEDSRNIKAIQPFRSGILVFAGNGVWYISNPDGGFKATAFNVEKISERSLESKQSIVEAEGAVFFISNNGIMQVVANEFNKLEIRDITEDTIQSHFLQKIAGRRFKGVYSEGDKQIIWWSPNSPSDGLIYDLRLQAFYPQRSDAEDWRIAATFSIVNAVYFIGANETDTRCLYHFTVLKDKQFQDFAVPQEAYLISGFETLGKFANKKSITQAKAIFRKTETQVLGYSNGTYTYDNPSSCLFQARWDFDKTDAGGRFSGDTGVTGKGKEMQLYKPLQRGFIPESFPAQFDTGERLITKKFNIRGNGDAVQFVFKAEPEKDLQLLGYSVNYTMRGRM